jgi:hypothetical protein
MISADAFAHAYRQESAEEWLPIPAVIIEYDSETEIGTVVPLIKQIYRDKSTEDLPQIYGVPIWSPRTAYAALKLPVVVGDKVLLVFTMRSLDNLLEADLSGTSIPDQVDPEDNKFKDYSFCVGLAGFNDENSAIGTDDSLHLLNNWNQVSENRLRLEKNGNVLLSNNVASAEMQIGGTITLANAAGTIVMSPTGQLTITAPLGVEVTTPLAHFSGNVTADGIITGADCVAAITGVTLATHQHPGDGGDGSGPLTGVPTV